MFGLTNAKKEMDSSNFTLQESRQLITNVIEEARNRFTDNGFSFIL